MCSPPCGTRLHASCGHDSLVHRKKRKGQAANATTSGSAASQMDAKLSAAVTKACMRTFMRSTKIDEGLVRLGTFTKSHARASGGSIQGQVAAVLTALDLSITSVEPDSDAWSHCGILDSGMPGWCRNDECAVRAHRVWQVPLPASTRALTKSL